MHPDKAGPCPKYLCLYIEDALRRVIAAPPNCLLFWGTRLCRRPLFQGVRIEKLIAVQGMTLGCTVKLETPCMSNSTSKFALNLVTISINMHLKIHLKNKQTSMANPLKSGPWSHVGKGGLPRWSHLGARWPRGAIFHRFCNPFWGSKMSFWRPQNVFKIDSKMKQFSDTPRNIIFCGCRSQRLQN